ncbi:hypothetical protein DFH11DRAFT_1555683 [Phellopilus nigrolimitatus]|nr:hypothetical protein DFH11DRAFT_1555683 [Phellopilus nigrolimitatus]
MSNVLLTGDQKKGSIVDTDANNRGENGDVIFASKPGLMPQPNNHLPEGMIKRKAKECTAGIKIEKSPEFSGETETETTSGKTSFLKVFGTLGIIRSQHLNLGFVQLNVSVEFELWQEAFRFFEDIHKLLNIAKKSPHPAMLANCYEKLTRIFLTSGSVLFHAAACAHYHLIARSVGGKCDEELGRLTGQVLICALAVPVGQESEEDEPKGQTAHLTALLGLTKTLARIGLLKCSNLLLSSSKNLYNVLEVTFDPLTLCSAVAPLRELPSDTNYLPLSLLVQVYSTMQIAQLLDFVTSLEGSFESAYGPGQVKAFLMSCTHRGDIRVRIDHASGSLIFINNTFSSTAAGPNALCARQVHPAVCGGIATCRHNSLGAIASSESAPAAADKIAAQETFAQLVAATNAERKALQVRRAIVARHRELVSELSVRKEKEEASCHAEARRSRIAFGAIWIVTAYID